VLEGPIVAGVDTTVSDSESWEDGSFGVVGASSSEGFATASGSGACRGLL